MKKGVSYEEFVDKFEPKKTTDDCYTPAEVFDVVAGWAAKRFGFKSEQIVRPFWPGGDYKSFEYPDGCVVLDNPPFSIFSEICSYYLDRGIAFFLFAPALTMLGGAKNALRMNHIVANADIVYENGAVVRTGFVTSFTDGTILQTAPDLCGEIKAVVDSIRAKTVKALPKYVYPDNLVTVAAMEHLVRYGVEFRLSRSECEFVRRLDAQRETGREVFGGGLLISERAAAERAAAERAAAERAAATVWQLSDRELSIVRSLGGGV